MNLTLETCLGSDGAPAVQLAVTQTSVAFLVLRQASSDDQLVNLQLHGRSPHTQRAYTADVERFRAYVGPLMTATLGHVQAFSDSLQGLAASSQARTLAPAKSLLSFGQRIGYLPMNVGAAVKLPPRTNTLAERILQEPDVQRMLALESA